MTQGVGNYLIAPLGNCLTLEGFSLGNYLIADTSRSKAAALPPTGSRLNSAQRFADTCRACLCDGPNGRYNLSPPPPRWGVDGMGALVPRRCGERGRREG